MQLFQPQLSNYVKKSKSFPEIKGSPSHFLGPWGTKDNKIKVSILTKDEFQNRYNKTVSGNTHFSRGKKVGATEPPELPPVLGDGRLGLRCPVGSHLPPPRSCHSPRNQHIHLRVEAFMCQRDLNRQFGPFQLPPQCG